MKTILYILIFNIGTICLAQDAQLFENTWYLKNIIINGQNNMPPDSSYYGELNIEPDVLYVGHSYCEAGFSANVIFDGTTKVDLNDIVVLVDSCGDPDIIEFIGKHYSIYMDSNLNPKNPLMYVITVAGNIKTLTITNPEGNQAIYGDEPLAIQDFKASQFSIYPNPVKGKLILSNSKTDLKDIKTKIYSIAGKLLSTQNINLEQQNSIDVSNLSKGIYFLNIENEDGNTVIKKFIKE